MRERDALGRPLPHGESGVEPVSEVALPPHQALTYAQALLDEGRAFSAHEVLEAVWKASPTDERDLWQGLAQLCVGVTHCQRGNLVGAVRLLRRGAEHLPDAPPYGVAAGLPRWGREVADRIESGDPTVPTLRLVSPRRCAVIDTASSIR